MFPKAEIEKIVKRQQVHKVNMQCFQKPQQQGAKVFFAEHTIVCEQKKRPQATMLPRSFRNIELLV
ncbi:MAG: hypothetical protein CVT93_02355 [Bacteroidetes bacterium HGW-Bacteroidetes-10]|nr:MAG: hypothetical protein CVT93_02355 [Bacteroidetes bacterium HGW-Bacteroidetes-10]